MTRPIYERPHDLDAERGIIEAVAAVTGTTPLKLPRSYSVDFAMLDETGLRAWVEVKRRSNPKAAYPTLLLSARKVMHGLWLAQMSGRPFMLAVQWEDTGPQWLRVEGLDGLMVQAGGRTDRGDSQDVEPVCLFPTASFKPLMRAAA
jgi:hypothetical protein